MAKGAGALAYRPGQFNLTEDQRSRFQQIKGRRGRRAARRYLRKQDQAGNLTPAGEDVSTEPVDEQGPVDPTLQQQATEGYLQTQGQINQGVGNAFGNVANQGAFNPNNLPPIPTDFQASRQRAADAAYDSFQRRMEPQFQQQQKDFEQKMYEQGVTPGSEKYNRLYEQMTQQQNDARLNAQNQAFLTGANEQQMQFGQGLAANQNAFGQQYQTWQAPQQQLGAMAPFYQNSGADYRMGEQLGYQNMAREDTQAFTGEQSQLDFQRQKELARLQNQLNIKYQNSIPRGGGGGSGIMPFDEWARRQDYAANIQQNQMFDQAVLNGMQGYPQYGAGFGGGFSQGFGAGAGMAVGGLLR